LLEESVWFAGAFRYHVPVGDSVWDKILEAESLANKLLGLRLTPEVVWNLTPWSWAADWFSNSGDVLHNISSLGQDGLLMQYGYIMRESKYKETVTCTSRPSVTTTREKFCRRLPANPYGFGLNDTDLSGIQKAIIAAVGLSHGRHGW
jgi:hypothetical protein